MAHARRLLALDPCVEVGHRLVMQVYESYGQRGLALRQYRVCVEVLRREYGTTPEPATQALFEHIRRRDLDAVASA
jgi:DNA-binding SARP family transcriptional activator